MKKVYSILFLREIFGKHHEHVSLKFRSTKGEGNFMIEFFSPTLLSFPIYGGTLPAGNKSLPREKKDWGAGN